MMKYQHPEKPDVSVGVIELAETFSRLMVEDLTVEELEAINIRNWRNRYGRLSCGTHDFIDGNEVMIEALKIHGIDGYSYMDHDLNELINHAWQYAKEHNFQPWEGKPVWPLEDLGQKIEKSYFDLMDVTTEAYELAGPPRTAFENLPPCYAAAEVLLDTVKQALAMVTDPSLSADDVAKLETLLCEAIEFAETPRSNESANPDS
jgi:hypothetical protein